MNPPFSHAGHRLGDKKTYGMDLKHVAQAMELLKPGGRLVAIVGAPMRRGDRIDDTKTFQNWFGKTTAKYDDRAHLLVKREQYRDYGTTFPSRLLVIEKHSPSGKTITNADFGGDDASFAQIVPSPLMQGIAYDRVPLPGNPDQPSSVPNDAPVGTGDQSVDAVQPPISDVGPGGEAVDA